MRLNEAVRLYCSINKIGVRKLGKEVKLPAATISRFLSRKTADGITLKNAMKIIDWLMEDDL